MKRHIMLSCLLSGLFFSIYAQSDIQILYPEIDNPLSDPVTGFGGYLVYAPDGQHYYISIYDNKDLFITRLNQEENPLWERKLEIPGANGSNPIALGVVVSENNELTISYYLNLQGSRTVIFRLSPDGALLWSIATPGVQGRVLKDENDQILFSFSSGADLFIQTIIKLDHQGGFTSGKTLFLPNWATNPNDKSSSATSQDIKIITNFEETADGPNPGNSSTIITSYDPDTETFSHLYRTVAVDDPFEYSLYRDFAYDSEGNQYQLILVGGFSVFFYLAKYDSNNTLQWCRNVGSDARHLLPMEDRMGVSFSRWRQGGLMNIDKETGDWISSIYYKDISFWSFSKHHLNQQDDDFLLPGFVYNAAFFSENNLNFEFCPAIVKMDSDGIIEGCTGFQLCEEELPAISPPPYSTLDGLIVQDITTFNRITISLNIEEVNLNFLPYCLSNPFTADFALDAPICPGDTIDFNTQFCIEGFEAMQNWSLTGPTTFNSTEDSIRYIFDVPGNYQITHTLEVEGCIDEQTYAFEVYAPPSVDLGQDTLLCENDSLLLESGFLPGTVDLIWQDSSQETSFLVQEGGLITLAVTNDAGCSAADSINISSIPAPIFTLGQDTLICEGSSLIFFPDASPAQAEYQWNNGSTASFINVQEPGLYTLIVTDNTTSCSASDSVDLSVRAAPLFTYQPQDTAFCPGIQLELSASAISHSTLTFSWSDGSEGLLYEVPSHGMQRLIGSDGVCSDTLMFNIPAGLCLADIYLPNVFSPNNDGRNDLFQPYGPDIRPLRIQIFNRWGGLVHEAEGENIAWDGTIKGEPASSGAYVYLLTYINELALEVNQIEGELLLIR